MRTKKNPWKTLRTKSVFKNPWIHLESDDVIQPGGKRSKYGVVRFQNIAVGVLVVDDKDRILLVGQWRYSLGTYSWEIPEGGCPLGTSVIQTARRELKEETGYTAGSIKKYLTMHLSNSVTDERAEIFIARNLKEGEPEPEATEVLATKWVTWQKALSLVESGKITDAMSVAAVLKFCLGRVDRQ